MGVSVTVRAWSFVVEVRLGTVNVESGWNYLDKARVRSITLGQSRWHRDNTPRSGHRWERVKPVPVDWKKER